MDIKEKKLLQLIDLYKSQEEILEIISTLPRGYISVKHISGHTYYYRQWRDGKRIISKYVEAAFVPGIEAKIALRKEHEAVLSTIKADIKKIQRYLLRHEVLSIEQLMLMKNYVKYDFLPEEEKADTLARLLPNYVDTKLGKKYISGEESYNRLYLTALGIL